MPTPAQPWRLSDRATVASDGTATVTLTHNGAQPFLVKRITTNVSTASATSSVCKLYEDRVADVNYLQGTNSGDGDVDTQPELEIQPGQSIVFYWTGAAVGASAFAKMVGKMGGE